MNDRRTDNRLLCAELVEICWEQYGRLHRRVANLEDISLTGVCLQTERSIPPETKLTIRYGDGELTGLVRYCAYRHMGFFVGVELEATSRWSTQHFRPRHLLDPRQLLQNTLMRQTNDPVPPSTAQ